jgi:hypothetical protein
MFEVAVLVGSGRRFCGMPWMFTEEAWMLGARPAPLTATADNSRPQSAATTGMHETRRPGMTEPPGPPDRPDSAVEQARSIFHELHADGRNGLCGVCDSQYWHGISTSVAR